MNDFRAREFWRFVLAQQEVARLAQTAIEYPPPQLTGLGRSLSGRASEIPILHSRPCEQDLAWLDPSRGKAVR
jgi:hypothetical protein